MKIVLIGPPASGKGTVAQRLSKELNIPKVVTGELLRREAKKDTDLGREIRELLKTGQILPMELVNAVLFKELMKLDSWILDGYPRSLEQKEALDNNKATKPDIVIFIDVSKETSEKRILFRRQCPRCGKVYNLITNPPKHDELCDECNVKLIVREDDKKEVLEKRWEEYKKKTFPVVEAYKKEGLLREVDGEKSIDEEYEEVKKIIEDFLKNK